MKRDFDADTVRELLDELVRRLEDRGVRGVIRVAGGAAMLLRFPDDPEVRVTSDIDAMIEPALRLRWSLQRWLRISGFQRGG